MRVIGLMVKSIVKHIRRKMFGAWHRDMLKSTAWPTGSIIGIVTTIFEKDVVPKNMPVPTADFFDNEEEYIFFMDLLVAEATAKNLTVMVGVYERDTCIVCSGVLEINAS